MMSYAGSHVGLFEFAGDAHAIQIFLKVLTNAGAKASSQTRLDVMLYENLDEEKTTAVTSR